MNTLRVRLIVTFLLVSIAAVSVVGLLSVNRARQAIIDTAWKEGEALVSALSANIDGVLRDRASILKVMAGQSAVRSMNWAEQQAALTPLYDQYDFSSIFVAGLDGVVHDVKLGVQEINVKDRDYFQKAIKEKKTVISEPVMHKKTGAWTYFYASPIVKDGAVVGILAAAENLENIAEIVASTVWGRSGYAYLLDGAGVLVAHPVKELIGELNATVEGERVAPELARGMRDGLAGAKGKL
ncbi:MAG: hypothetical protein CVV55_02620, partial [Synergistetes bacterium HGW-Synergistetes-2]